MKKIYLLLLMVVYTCHINAQEYINLQLNSAISGTYDYRAKESVVLKPGFSYQGATGTTLRAAIDPMIILNPNPQDTYGGADNGLVGVVDGSANVGPSGGASYEVPIKITPGTGGMAPQLSIVYSSQGSDGLLGTGFSMSGLSAISRCGSTLDNDGVIDPVDFDSNDRFMLDGSRLIAIQGTYGANGTIYRTESNSFSKIISYSSGSTGPDRFEVYTKSGLIYDYGATTDSKFMGGSYVIYWLVNKVCDTKGNYYTITYVQDATNGEYRPSRIDYTGNPNSTPVLQPYASVRFEYTIRNATQNVYVNGTKSKISNLLNKIKVFLGETEVKEYQLGYNTQSFGKYLLASITEVGKNGYKYNATKFDWFTNNSFTHTEQIYDQSYYANAYVSKADITIGDFNGDGQTDFISTPKASASFTGWRLFLADASGTKCNYTYTGALQTGFTKLYAGDFNGDGKTDII